MSTEQNDKYMAEIKTDEGIRKLLVLLDECNELLRVSGAFKFEKLLYCTSITNRFTKDELLCYIEYLVLLGELKQATDFDKSSIYQVFIKDN